MKKRLFTLLDKIYGWDEVELIPDDSIIYKKNGKRMIYYQYSDSTINFLGVVGFRTIMNIIGLGDRRFALIDDEVFEWCKMRFPDLQINEWYVDNSDENSNN